MENKKDGHVDGHFLFLTGTEKSLKGHIFWRLIFPLFKSNVFLRNSAVSVRTDISFLHFQEHKLNKMNALGCRKVM